MSTGRALVPELAGKENVVTAMSYVSGEEPSVCEALPRPPPQKGRAVVSFIGYGHSGPDWVFRATLSWSGWLMSTSGKDGSRDLRRGGTFVSFCRFSGCRSSSDAPEPVAGLAVVPAITITVASLGVGDSARASCWWLSSTCRSWHRFVRGSSYYTTGAKAIGMTFGPALGGIFAEPAVNFPSIFPSDGLYARWVAMRGCSDSRVTRINRSVTGKTLAAGLPPMSLKSHQDTR